jgi:hypothetical protein
MCYIVSYCKNLIVDALDRNFIKAANSVIDIKTAFNDFINTLNDVKAGTKTIEDLKTSFESLSRIVPSIKKLDINVFLELL